MLTERKVKLSNSGNSSPFQIPWSCLKCPNIPSTPRYYETLRVGVLGQVEERHTGTETFTTHFYRNSKWRKRCFSGFLSAVGKIW
jgi:hypothetical protein